MFEIENKHNIPDLTLFIFLHFIFPIYFLLVIFSFKVSKNQTCPSKRGNDLRKSRRENIKKIILLNFFPSSVLSHSKRLVGVRSKEVPATIM